MQPTDHKPPSPSLRGGPVKTDSRRILASLEQESEGTGVARQRKRPRLHLSLPSIRRSSAAAALLLALAFAAWWTWRTAAPPGLRPVSTGAATPARPPSARADDAPVATALPPGPAAAIVNETSATDPAAATPLPYPHRPATLEWPATTAVAAAARAAAGKPADKAIRHGDASNEAPGPRAKAAPAAPVPLAPADSDVQLLTALVAHANGLPATAPSRDVVQRKDGDSTATLLQRCKALGPIEGMLCRSRICSGRWDEDAACNR